MVGPPPNPMLPKLRGARVQKAVLCVARSAAPHPPCGRCMEVCSAMVRIPVTAGIALGVGVGGLPNVPLAFSFRGRREVGGCGRLAFALH